MIYVIAWTEGTLREGSLHRVTTDSDQYDETVEDKGADVYLAYFGESDNVLAEAKADQDRPVRNPSDFRRMKIAREAVAEIEASIAP